MLLLAEAQQQLIARYPFSEAYKRCDTIELPLDQALSKVAAQDVISTLDIPPSDNSAMDGFAVNTMDVSHSTPLPISQRVPAGQSPEQLNPGTAARIFTGAELPKGANAVVIQENCEFTDHQVVINTHVRVMDNIRPQGQDIKSGATVIKQGKRLSAVDLSLLASIGEATVRVYQPLTVAVFSTGDELAEPGQTLEPGQIYNSNRPLLMALLKQCGFAVLDCGIVEDNLKATQAALSQAADQADAIISSGGVSVGEEDHVRPAVESLGALDFWKVQMKPGKPVAIGQIHNTPFMGLPGNPVSSFVVFQLLGLPLLQSLQGERYQAPKAYIVTAGFNKKTTSREDYIRVQLRPDDAGQPTAYAFNTMSSGVMSSLAWADGVVRQKIDQSIDVGDSIEFLPLTNGVL